VIWFAARLGPHRWSRPKNRLLILMYHRVLPPFDRRCEIEQPGMIVHPENFERQIRILKEYFDVVRLSQWLRTAAAGSTLPARACAITFDDGWADNYEYAFPIVVRHSTPCTVYLVSDMVGSKSTFWPEALARCIQLLSTHPERSRLWQHENARWVLELEPTLLKADSLDRYQIDTVINSAKNTFTDNELRRMTSCLEAMIDSESRNNGSSILNWDQVSEMHDSGLVEFGSHTRAHTRLLPDLSHSVLQHEIVQSKAIIEKRLNAPVDLFCYPNGDTSPAAVDLVRSNYAGAVTTKSGWNSPDSDPILLHRVGIHQGNSYNETAFLARLSGWV